MPRQARRRPCVPEFLPASRHEGVPLRAGQHAAIHLSLPQLELYHSTASCKACRCTEALRRSRPQRVVAVAVAKLANYKGRSGRPGTRDAPEFVTYLGDAKDHLDQVLDCRDGREGGSEVFGVHKWVFPANWKFAAENFLGDTYHNPSHRSVDLIGIGPSARSGKKRPARQRIREGPARLDQLPGGPRRAQRVQPQNTTISSPSRTTRPRRILPPLLRGAQAPARASRRGSAVHRHDLPEHLLSWPSAARAVRLAPAQRDADRRLALLPGRRDAPREVKDFLRRYYMRYSGPAGMTEQDDMENWLYATAASMGTIARRYPFNYQQSLGAWTRDHSLGGTVSLRSPRRLRAATTHAGSLICATPAGTNSSARDTPSEKGRPSEHVPRRRLRGCCLPRPCRSGHSGW